MGTRVLLPEYILTCTYFKYSSTFKIKVLVYILEYLELVLLPNTVHKYIIPKPNEIHTREDWGARRD